MNNRTRWRDELVAFWPVTSMNLHSPVRQDTLHVMPEEWARYLISASSTGYQGINRINYEPKIVRSMTMRRGHLAQATAERFSDGCVAFSLGVRSVCSLRLSHYLLRTADAGHLASSRFKCLIGMNVAVSPEDRCK